MNTLEANAGKTALNYSTLPTIDVEILERSYHCATCGGEIANTATGPYASPTWEHVEGTSDHRATPRTACAYCNSDEHATYRQHSWHDAIECSRCGGINGWPIGD